MAGDVAGVRLRDEDLEPEAERRRPRRARRSRPRAGEIRICCRARIANAPAPAISPAGKSGIPNSRLSPSAAPTTSAMSVDIATSSACSQRPIEVRREKFSRQSSGRFLPGRDPELRRLGLDQHRDQVCGDDHPEQQIAELRPAGDVGREVAGVDVGDGGDERRAEKRPDASRAANVAVERAPGGPRDRGLAGQHRLDLGVRVEDEIDIGIGLRLDRCGGRRWDLVERPVGRPELGRLTQSLCPGVPHRTYNLAYSKSIRSRLTRIGCDGGHRDRARRPVPGPPRGRGRLRARAAPVAAGQRSRGRRLPPGTAHERDRVARPGPGLLRGAARPQGPHAGRHARAAHRGRIRDRYGGGRRRRRPPPPVDVQGRPRRRGRGDDRRARDSLRGRPGRRRGRALRPARSRARPQGGPVGRRRVARGRHRRRSRSDRAERRRRREPARRSATPGPNRSPRPPPRSSGSSPGGRASGAR